MHPGTGSRTSAYSLILAGVYGYTRTRKTTRRAITLVTSRTEITTLIDLGILMRYAAAIHDLEDAVVRFRAECRLQGVAGGDLGMIPQNFSHGGKCVSLDSFCPAAIAWQREPPRSPFGGKASSHADGVQQVQRLVVDDRTGAGGCVWLI